jgi:hypothetical protein
MLIDVHTSSRACTPARFGIERGAASLDLVRAAGSRPRRVTDPTWAPRHATVGMVGHEREARHVYQLRYRVYIHEQGRRPDGVDWERCELVDPLDPCSCLWYARDGESVVGTITQTIIGADFDLTRLPSALQLDAFPRSASCPLGYSSRFAIAPDHRSTWVLASLARYSYAHGRGLGGKFDFMATNPGLVPLFERLGYIRYTTSAIHTNIQSNDVGLLIPMVLPATDYEHLRNVRSACLPAAAHFPAEPKWGAWLRATHPIIGIYYGSDVRHERRGAAIAQRIQIPMHIAAELSSMSFVHHFPAGTPLRRAGDRVTYSFLALDGQVSVNRVEGADEAALACAPDGVAFSRVSIQCETDAVVLCVPDAAVIRLQRRYPEHAARLQRLVARGSAGDMEDAHVLR